MAGFQRSTPFHDGDKWDIAWLFLLSKMLTRKESLVFKRFKLTGSSSFTWIVMEWMHWLLHALAQQAHGKGGR